MPINRGLDKEEVAHIHSGILLSHKKDELMLFCSNMDRPRGYHTKLTQTEKDNYHMLSLTCGV